MGIGNYFKHLVGGKTQPAVNYQESGGGGELYNVTFLHQVPCMTSRRSPVCKELGGSKHHIHIKIIRYGWLRLPPISKHCTAKHSCLQRVGTTILINFGGKRYEALYPSCHNREGKKEIDFLPLVLGSRRCYTALLFFIGGWC